MKKYLLLILVLITTVRLGIAQQTDSSAVPSVVSNAFSLKYAKVKIKGWCKDEGAWMIKFKSGGMTRLAYYTPDGTWLKTETKYGFTHSLLPGIKAGWQKCSFRAWYIDEIMELETPQLHVYRFEVDNSSLLDVTHIYNFKQNYHLYFADNGDFIKAEKLP